MYDGVKREVSIYDLNADADIAHIRVVGSDLPYLEIADGARQGDTVYALAIRAAAAPASQRARCSTPANSEYLTTMIESSATVVSGNSGGALVNSRGELLGITVSSQSGGSPSFSVPISVLDEMDGTVALSPQQYTQAHRPDASRCYENRYPVPDFGAVTGVPLYAHTRDRGTGRFYYRMADYGGQQSAAARILRGAGRKYILSVL